MFLEEVLFLWVLTKMHLQKEINWRAKEINELLEFTEKALYTLHAPIFLSQDIPNLWCKVWSYKLVNGFKKGEDMVKKSCFYQLHDFQLDMDYRNPNQYPYWINDNGLDLCFMPKITLYSNLKYTNPAIGILDFCKQKHCRALPCQWIRFWLDLWLHSHFS